jgi:hypothetical protein
LNKKMTQHVGKKTTAEQQEQSPEEKKIEDAERVEAIRKCEYYKTLSFDAIKGLPNEELDESVDMYLRIKDREHGKVATLDLSDISKLEMVHFYALGTSYIKRRVKTRAKSREHYGQVAPGKKLKRILERQKQEQKKLLAKIRDSELALNAYNSNRQKARKYVESCGDDDQDSNSGEEAQNSSDDEMLDEINDLI